MSDEQDADSGHLRRNYGKEKNNYPGCNHAVIGAVGGTGYYYRDNVIDVATEAFDVVAEKIPFYSRENRMIKCMLKKFPRL